jgi:hypothetical protein
MDAALASPMRKTMRVAAFLRCFARGTTRSAIVAPDEGATPLLEALGI